MALSIDLELVSGTQATIPSPTKPADNGDTDVSAYVPKGMSSADREALRAAGKEWAGTLGGFVAHRHPTKSAAARNVDHFMTQKGKEKVYGASDIEELMGSLNSFGTQVAKSLPQIFVEKVYADIKDTTSTIRRYRAQNTGSSVNAGTHWFGVTAETGTEWFYAVGAFLMACSGYAVRTDFDVTIFYRIFIYDRYNWDINEDGSGKETAVPTMPLSVFLDDGKMNAISHLKLPNGRQSYFRTDAGGYDGNTESYVVNDALMGALVESGDAKNFDITGAGAVHWVRLVTAPKGKSGPATIRQQGTVR